MPEPKNFSPIRVRRMLNDVLRSDSDLNAFCLDRFPEVAQRFTGGMDRVAKVNFLLMQVPLVELVNRLREAYPEVERFMQRASGEDSEDNLPPANVGSSETPRGRSVTHIPVLWLSFADDDLALANELSEHLAVFIHQGVLRQIPAPLPVELHTLPEPDIIVLLLSRKYLANGQRHIQEALRQHQGPRHPILLTVLLTPAMWESTPLVHVAPPLLDARPLSSFADRDASWVDVANAVRQAILFPPTSQRELLPQHVNVPAPGGPARSLADVFVYAGPSKLIFVETAQSRELVQRLRLPTVPDGLVVEGPSGIGKTTAVLRALDALQAQKRYLYISSTDERDLAELDRQVRDNVPQAGYLVVDDFHQLDAPRKGQVARLVKRLCDRNRRDTKVVIVGINPIGASLVEALPDIRGRFSVISLQGRQPDEKIDELIALGESVANVEFQRRSRFIDEAQGSFALAQRLCYEATRLAGVTERPPEQVLIRVPAQDVVTQVLKTLEQYYRPRLLAFAAWDEKPPPRGASLYLLWHLARDNDGEDGSVMLHELRLKYRQDPNLDAAFGWLAESNLHRLFEELPRLRQLLHYRRMTGALSAEDPQLWFYLRHLNWVKFAQASGHAVEDSPDDSGKPRLCAVEVPKVATAPSVTITDSERTSLQPQQQAERFHLVHLSDLHFNHKEQASRFYSQLAEDLRHELKLSRIDALILSGDITNRGKQEGYDVAEQFLLLLSAELDLKPHQIVIVPGNHDLNWDLSKEAYVPYMRHAWKGVLRPGVDFEEGPQSRYVEVRDDEKHKLRLRPFADFYQRVRRQLYPLHPADQALVYHFEEAGLLLLGLNSAWQIDHNFQNHPAIHDLALGRALDEIRMTPLYDRCPRKLAIFHHPIGGGDDSRLRDTGFLERLAQAGFSAALHGHVHEAGDWSWPYYRSNSGFHILGAGTFGAADKSERSPSVPLQYQVLEILRDRMIIHSRRRNRDTGSWEPDPRFRLAPGTPNVDSIEIVF